VLSQTKALHYHIVMSVVRRDNTVSAVVIVHFLQQQEFPNWNAAKLWCKLETNAD
jgi:hypothetical protein